MPREDEVTLRAGRLRALTGFTAPELTARLPHCARALAAYRQDRPSEGQPRTSRRDRAADHGPWPTRADPRLFMRTDVHQQPLREGQGQLCGRRQSPAHPGLHLRPPVWPHA
jgi:hypothetical protein